MWKSKRFVIIAVILAVVLVGGIAGIAIAQTRSSTTTPTAASTQTLAARVAKILGIDQAKVQSAFDQARKDMANDALDARLKALVASGKITQQQADQYRSWWQSRPNVNIPGPGPMGRFGKMGRMGFPKLNPPTTTPAP